MREILADVENWLGQGEKIAIATVINTWGSSPRRVGAKMALTPNGKIAGSVSGGCVEGAVFEAGVEVLESGQPQLLHFGVADETAWSVGLACGGKIDVFVQPMQDSDLDLLRAGQQHVAATVVRGPRELVGCEMLIVKGQPISHGISPTLDAVIVEKARAAEIENQSQVTRVQTESGFVEVFLDVERPQPVLVLVGGVHIAIALTSIAKALGFHTVVIDPRKAFGSPERFPHVDRLIQEWPQDAFAQIEVGENTAIAMLTHDPKIDDPALKIALKSGAFYIGALGSDSTQARRRARLLEAGISQDELARLHGPIGLKLGSDTPEEIALAVMAEIVAVQHHAIH